MFSCMVRQLLLVSLAVQLSIGSRHPDFVLEYGILRTEYSGVLLAESVLGLLVCVFIYSVDDVDVGMYTRLYTRETQKSQSVVTANTGWGFLIVRSIHQYPFNLEVRNDDRMLSADIITF